MLKILYIHRLPVYFLALFTISCYGCSRRPSQQVCLRNVCVEAELVSTSAQRSRGLMHRKKLGDKQGMLFIFESEDYHGFWMKNMHFPLDILWLSADKKVVDIHQFALPCKDVCKNLIPKAKASYVLEVNAGFVQSHRVAVGDTVNF